MYTLSGALVSQATNGCRNWLCGVHAMWLKQPVGTKKGWGAGVGQGLDESILQGGGVPLSFKV